MFGGRPTLILEALRPIPRATNFFARRFPPRRAHACDKNSSTSPSTAGIVFAASSSRSSPAATSLVAISTGLRRASTPEPATSSAVISADGPKARLRARGRRRAPRRRRARRRRRRAAARCPPGSGLLEEERTTGGDAVGGGGQRGAQEEREAAREDALDVQVVGDDAPRADRVDDRVEDRAERHAEEMTVRSAFHSARSAARERTTTAQA